MSILSLSRVRLSSLALVLCSVAFLAPGCAEEKAPEASNPGGVGPGTDTLPDVAGCSAATAASGTEVGIDENTFTYTPACLKVKVGTVVTFTGGGAKHPLAPMTKGTTADNPIPLSKDPSVPVTFAKAGAFPYFCENHGVDGGATGMVGAVYVVP